MINLKESCRTCPKLKRCIKTVAYNINNVLLPIEKDWMNCADFEHLESAAKEYIMYGLEKALMDFKVEAAMDYTYKIFEQAMLHADNPHKCVKKVKVSSALFDYLKAISDPFGLGPSKIPEGKMDYWTGIPIEVDDEIDGHYEFVY